MDIKEYPVGTIFGQEEISAIERVLNSGEPLTRGSDVELFEQEFATYCSAKYAVAVSSCGAALEISSMILNLNEGDEVICQANSFWVTINHLIRRNVKIICVDINPRTLNIDENQIESLISDKTKAIYLVHHGGNPANLDPIRNIADRYHLTLVEDCAHAVGSEYHGKKIGSDSDLACFSFSSLKNISTLGEGGMIVTKHKEFADLAIGFRTNYPFGLKVKKQVRSLGDFPKPSSPAFMHMGDAWDYNWHRLDEMGSTYRMSTPQAAVGRVQLKKLDSLIGKRKKIADKYNQVIKNIEELELLQILPNCIHNWHLYSFFLEQECPLDRDTMVKILDKEFGIHIVIRYFPINLGGILRMRGCKQGGCEQCSKLKNIERMWFEEQMSLPISPQMKSEEIDYFCESITKIFNG